MAVLNLNNIVYVAMWLLVTYSNYFEIVSTVAFLDCQTEFITGRFLYKTVILYHCIFAMSRAPAAGGGLLQLQLCHSIT